MYNFMYSIVIPFLLLVFNTDIPLSVANDKKSLRPFSFEFGSLGAQKLINFSVV